MSTKKSAAEKDAEKARKAKEKKTGLRQPDPEHTTDPQEHMKGPVSSFMQKVKDKVEDNDQKDKEDPELEHQK